MELPRQVHTHSHRDQTHQPTKPNALLSVRACSWFAEGGEKHTAERRPWSEIPNEVRTHQPIRHTGLTCGPSLFAAGGPYRRYCWLSPAMPICAGRYHVVHGEHRSLSSVCVRTQEALAKVASSRGQVDVACQRWQELADVDQVRRRYWEHMSSVASRQTEEGG